MLNIYLFTSNLKLKSFEKFSGLGKNADKNIFLTTHYLFDNEREYLEKLFPNCIFRNFADYLTDSEMAECDEKAYEIEKSDYQKYLAIMKEIKNAKVLANLKKEFPEFKGYILSDDLGIDKNVWKQAGFKQLRGEYYYLEIVSFSRKIKRLFGKIKLFRDIYFKLKGGVDSQKAQEVYVSEYNGKKIIFVGKMHRIGYRLNLDFKKSEEELEKFNNGVFYPKEECQYITTWHEHYRCNVPDDKRYDVRWIQDGYLPPNYSEYGYNFIPSNVQYYAWDVLGEQLFHNKKLPVSLIPYRKKLYMPNPKFPNEVKNVLIVASGSGDWTALKNRSDDDMLVDGFVKIAKKYPNINFVYRCHPTWVHPNNLGVNAINRVAEFFASQNLPNLVLSASMPSTNLENFQLSFSRSSLDEDLKNADLVFGEHSISMIDAAFKELPFASVNLTKRRNFYCGITDMGFMYCNSLEDVSNVIGSIAKPELQSEYPKWVKKYNEMTDEVEG